MKLANEIKVNFLSVQYTIQEEDVKDLNQMPCNRENIIMQYKTYILYKDKYPVTEYYFYYLFQDQETFFK